MCSNMAGSLSPPRAFQAGEDRGRSLQGVWWACVLPLSPFFTYSCGPGHMLKGTCLLSGSPRDKHSQRPAACLLEMAPPVEPPRLPPLGWPEQGHSSSLGKLCRDLASQGFTVLFLKVFLARPPPSKDDYTHGFFTAFRFRPKGF